MSFVGLRVLDGVYETKAVTLGVGTTVATGSHYLGDGDTDYFAVYWDEEKQAFVNGGHSYFPVNATIDATLEIQAAYQAKLDAESAARRAEWARQQEIEAEQEAATPRKGKTVTVVKGRKVPIGTTGEVIWHGESSYRYGGYRVGIKDAEGNTHWTAASNVRVVQATQEQEVAV